MNQIVAAPNLERLSGAIERVTFHSEASGFCVLRVKVKGYREVVTVVGSTDMHCALWLKNLTTQMSEPDGDPGRGGGAVLAEAGG